MIQLKLDVITLHCLRVSSTGIGMIHIMARIARISLEFCAISDTFTGDDTDADGDQLCKYHPYVLKCCFFILISLDYDPTASDAYNLRPPEFEVDLENIDLGIDDSNISGMSMGEDKLLSTLPSGFEHEGTSKARVSDVLSRQLY
jgi:hypothetical protein